MSDDVKIAKTACEAAEYMLAKLEYDIATSPPKKMRGVFERYWNFLSPAVRERDDAYDADPNTAAGPYWLQFAALQYDMKAKVLAIKPA